MTKQWGDVNMEERAKIFQAMKEAIEAEGCQDVVTIKSLDQFVGNLAQGEMMNQCHLIVEGTFKADEKAKIQPLLEKLQAAAGDVKITSEMSASIA